MSEEPDAPRQAEIDGVDLTDPEYRIYALAFNAVGRALGPHQFLPFSTRQAIADGVRKAIAEEIRSNPLLWLSSAVEVAEMIGAGCARWREQGADRG